MTKHITYVKVKFIGPYQWGKGWVATPNINDWDTAWINAVRKHCYGWQFVKSKDGMSSPSLISLKTAIYLHPMGFDAMFIDCGCMCNGKYNESEVEDLYEMCKEVAGEFNAELVFERTEETEINLDLKPYEAA